MEFKVTEGSYCISWSEWELEGRTAVLLIFRPLRLYRERRAKNISIQVHRPITAAYRKLPTMPDGLYEYYLADTTDGPPIEEKTPYVIGAKRPLPVKLSPGSDSSYHCLELTSPLPLKAGECGIDYGICRPVPLPGTQPDSGGHMIRCLIRLRPELPAKLYYAEELHQMLHVDERYLSHMH